MPGFTLEELQAQGATPKQAGGFSLEELETRGAETPGEPGGLSFAERVGEDIAERGAKFAEGAEAESLGKQTKAETILGAVGQGAGLLFDIGGELLVSGLKLLPDFIKDPIKEIGRDILDTPLGQAGIRAVSRGVEEYNEWKAANPRAARNLEASVNIALLLPAGTGSRVVGKAGLGVTEKAAGAVAKTTKKRLSKQIVDEALDVLKPKLTTLEKQKALQAGRGVVTAKILPRKFEKISLKPTARELEMAEVLGGVVKKSKNPIDNITAIDKEIGRIARLTEKGLIDNNTIFNKAQLRSALNKTKADSRIVFGSDKTLQNSYDSVIDEMIEQATKTKGNLSGLLQARKNFDNVINDKFPGILENPVGDIVKKNAIRDVRRSVNEFVANKLPDGNPFKAQLRQQNLGYDGIKNIAKKTASSVDASTVQKAMAALRQNPLVAGVTGGILTFAALTGLLSNPLVIGALIAGGTIKIGSSVITSKILKKMLIETATAIEKGAKALGSKEGVKALRTIASQLPE